MMKRIVHIVLLLMLYLLFCGKSCSDEGSLLHEQEEEVKAEKDRIRNEFGVSYLTDESRYASEIAAVQKLRDLPDLVSVFADTSLDQDFRLQAGDMIRSSFISGTSLLSFDPFVAEREIMPTVDEMLGSAPADTLIRAKVSFDSIHVVMPLQRTAEGRYSGSLGCRQFVVAQASGDTLRKDPYVEVGVVVIRGPKVFGRDTLQVWNIFLGDMRPGVQPSFLPEP